MNKLGTRLQRLASRAWAGVCPRAGPWLAALVLAALAAPPAHAADPAPRIALSAAERDWLRAHPRITIALDDTNPPMNFRQADGTFAGASLDYLALVGQIAGVQMQFVGAPWNETLRRAMAHEVDGVLGARYREERRGKLDFTAPYLQIPIALAVQRGHATVTKLQDLQRERVAVVRGTVRVPMVRQNCPACTVLEVDAPLAGVKLVANGGADAFFDDLPVIQNALEIGLIADVKVALYYYADAGAVRVGVRNDAPQLLAVLDKAIAAITPAEHAAIRAKWLRLSQDVTVQRDIRLSDDEYAWVQAHPVVRVAVAPDRPPLEFRDAEGRMVGISLDLLARLGETLGLRFEYTLTHSTAERLALLKRGEVDLISLVAAPLAGGAQAGAADEPLYSQPYLSSPHVVFANGDFSYVNNLRELAGKRAALVRFGPLAEQLGVDWPAVKQVAVGTVAEGLDKLARREADVYIGSLLVTGSQLVNSGRSDMRIVGDTPYNLDLGLAVRRDWPLLLAALNKAIAAIPAGDHDAIKQRWVSLRVQPRELDVSLLAWFGAALLAGSAGALLFIRQLQRMVRQRTGALRDEVARGRERAAALAASDERFRRLLEIAPDAIVVLDYDTQMLVEANRQAETLFACSRERLLAEGVRGFYTDEQPDGRPFSQTWPEYQARVIAGEELRVERRLRAADGQEKLCAVHLVRLASSSDRVIRYSYVDITAQRHAEQQIKQLNAELEQRVESRTRELTRVNRDLTHTMAHLREAQAELVRSEKLAALGSLVAGVAHELNTPISNALLTVSSLHERYLAFERDYAAHGLRRASFDAFRAQVGDATELALRAIERSAALVKKFKQLALDQDGLRRGRFNLRELVDSVLMALRPSFEGSGATLDVQVPAGLMLDSFPGALEQVLDNLVGNAVQHGLRGRAHGRVTLRAQAHGDRLRLSVADDGRGIDAADLPRIFDPFYSTRFGQGGSGLGLHVAHNCVTRILGGTLTVRSTPGQGSEFVAELPLTAPALVPAVAPDVAQGVGAK